jgi:acetyl esterase/lipase
MTGEASRRHFIAATAAACAVSGCTGGDSSEPTTEPATDEPESTAEATATTTETPTTPTDIGDGVTLWSDITFRKGDDFSLALDLYLPEGSGAPFLVFAHGGGWIGGDKGRRDMHSRMAEAGIAVADIQYRLAPTHQYPAAVRDTVAAVKWVRANADEYGIDPERGALGGYSAGAHLSALVAVAPDHETFQPVDYYPDQPVAVDALVGYSGPYDFTRGGAGENGLVQAFFGDDEQALREGSPTTHVDSEDPPALLIHGTEDRVVPYRSTTVMADTLEEAGVPVDVVTGDGVGHGMIDSAEWRSETLPAQREFLLEHLGVA